MFIYYIVYMWFSPFSLEIISLYKQGNKNKNKWFKICFNRSF